MEKARANSLIGTRALGKSYLHGSLNTTTLIAFLVPRTSRTTSSIASLRATVAGAGRCYERLPRPKLRDITRHRCAEKTTRGESPAGRRKRVLLIYSAADNFCIWPLPCHRAA